MFKLKLFALSLLLTTGLCLILIYFQRPKRTESVTPELVRIANNLFITSQLAPGNVRVLKSRGVLTIIDIRPDGEERGQASSSEIGLASKRYGIDFHYLPVPHESIPDGAVAGLSDVLSRRATPAVLYCRSGRRAVRTFALAEASRTDGPNADAIVDMVRVSGFSADDLRDNIDQRISRRNSPPAEKN